MSNRVVVTGMGVVSPIGNDLDTVWNSLCAGKSGIDAITAFDVSDYPCKIAGEVRDLEFTRYVDLKEAKRTDRFVLFAIAAAHMAVEHSGIDLSSIDTDRVGTVIGTGIGGLSTLEAECAKLIKRGPSRVSPFLIPMMIPDMASGMVSMKLGLRGPNYSLVSACASGAHAVGDSMLAMRAGMMDVAICGGTEATITPLGIAGFCSAKTLSTRNDEPWKASSPFDKKRDGFVMGEGAGILVLETLEHALDRGATIYGEVVGYGATGDAHHITAPSPGGEGAQRAMRMALKSAELSPERIGYINAHGTSTPLNDKYESAAIAKVFGDHTDNLAISSTKSMTGHLLGASGGFEIIATTLAIRNGIIPPTINYEDPDPECPLNYTPNEAVEKRVTYAMSNSFGFGGHNAALIIKKYESSQNDG
ncbi:MAG: beta-ketoacyl-ACP synthase II [Chitinivibrionales bacterium]|nr:beta-ketoacyl-ACP synthase II [Chitinivibrionales bacterium]